jgi:hypothetical protein
MKERDCESGPGALGRWVAASAGTTKENFGNRILNFDSFTAPYSEIHFGSAFQTLSGHAGAG